MCSSGQPDKEKLLAIHTLKFYKNKEKWKLYEDMEEESHSNSKLNETYNVDNVELVSAHNKAFLDLEPADEAPTQQECGPKLPDSPCQCRQPGDQLEPPWQDAQQEWCGVEGEGSADELAERPQYIPWARPAWPADFECDVKPDYGPLKGYECDLEPDYVPGNGYECDLKTVYEPVGRPLSPHAVLSAAEQWLRNFGREPAGFEEPLDDCSCMALDESVEFVCGAHLAPHSSETDLTAMDDTWTGPRVLRGVRAHCRALARLLALAEPRPYGSSPVHPPTYDEYPTRDTDPLRPPDFILSGSHRPADTRWLSDWPPAREPHRPPDAVPAGRGRGRLQRSEPIIGIAMGRPYRM